MNFEWHNNGGGEGRWRHPTLWTPGQDDIVSCHRCIVPLYDPTLLIVWAADTTLLPSAAAPSPPHWRDHQIRQYYMSRLNRASTQNLWLSDCEEGAFVDRSRFEYQLLEDFTPQRMVGVSGLHVAVASVSSLPLLDMFISRSGVHSSVYPVTNLFIYQPNVHTCKLA